MIVKVAPKRRDGKSSFTRLSTYLTDGIHQSGEVPTKTSWEALTQYITAASVIDSLGDEVDKTIAVEIGNLNSLKTAAHEMEAVAMNNTRQKDPVYHYILSWPEGERPDPKLILEAARDSLKALGMQDHQYIVAVHANTDNIHAHIEVNRIHPKTFKAARLEWAHKTLHRFARECEIKFGWSHDRGIFEVVEVEGKKHVVKSTTYIDPELVPARHGANRFETWSGTESLETFCKGDPASELKKVLAKDTTTSWQDIHRVLARYGLELKDTGGGGMQVHDVSEEKDEKKGKPLAVSASKAFRFLKRVELEEKLGKFEARSPNLTIDEPGRTYKRDPLKRLERRLERKAARDALRDRYREESNSARTKRGLAISTMEKQFAHSDKARFAAITTQYLAMRMSIRSSAMESAQKQQAYMLAKMTMLRATAQLKAQLREERKKRRELLPTLPSWRAWVEQQALLGDEAAISALRGMIYQEGRDAKRKAQEGENTENAILPASPRDTDPNVRNIRNLIWKVSKNGQVNYSFKDGAPAFTDEGVRLTYGRKEVEREALAASLVYAAEKWGQPLRVAGADQRLKERIVRLSVELGIELKNTDLRNMQRQVEDELAHVRKVQRATSAGTPKHEQTVEARILAKDSKATFRFASPVTGPYVGKIVGQDTKYVAQHLGKNDYVLHERDAFDGPLPRTGQQVTVGYSGTKATLAAINDKDRGRK